MKAKVIVEYIVDVPITANEAARAYPDCLWPKEALALDKISELGLSNMVKEQSSTATVTDVVLKDD